MKSPKQGASLELNVKSDLNMGFPGGSEVKNPPAVQEPQEMQVRSLGQEDPLEWDPLQCSCLENPRDGGA